VYSCSYFHGDISADYSKHTTKEPGGKISGVRRRLNRAVLDDWRRGCAWVRVHALVVPAAHFAGTASATAATTPIFPARAIAAVGPAAYVLVGETRFTPWALAFGARTTTVAATTVRPAITATTVWLAAAGVLATHVDRIFTG